MIEYRTPEDGDLDSILALSEISFPLPPGWVARARPTIRLEQFLCAFEDGRLVASSQSHPMDQWFGGRPVPSAGVAGVATLPERRGGGVVTGLLPELLRRERERGMAASSLYAATVPVYRRLGYGWGGSYLEHRVGLRDLPSAPMGGLREMDVEADLPAVQASYRRFAATQAGCAEGRHPDWWSVRVFRRWNPEDPARGVVLPGSDGLDGYAFFRRENLDFGFRVSCTHLVATTPQAYLALLGYFRRFQGVGMELGWHGPPNDPVEHLVAERVIRIGQTFPWMFRLLDVPSALEARGYPEVSGQVVLAVDDPLFEDNRGPFRVTADCGKVNVERDAGPAGAARLASWALASMYTGRSSAHDLVRAGGLEGDDGAIRFLSELFAGPSPWMPDFF
jgi:predicted acetyltransferase